MKGLDLAENYFDSWGMSMLEKQFSDSIDRVAAGLVGDGSECFGFDDEISRDHDWGPGFCLFLAEGDYRTMGQQLQQAYEKLPAIHMGFGRMESRWGQGRIGVFETGAFYRKYTGLPHPPETLMDWMRIPEQHLAVCTNGRVFHDPLGEFTRWRETLLAFYPEDVRLKKIAARCMQTAQSGQYNLIRSIQRNEPFAARYAETKFCSDLISLVFMLNRRYMPFYKWMHRGLELLPILGKAIYDRIGELIANPGQDEKNERVEDICRLVILELQSQGLSDASSSFLLDHGPVIQRRIEDDQLRSMDVWVG